jgi:hypothetical protein
MSHTRNAIERAKGLLVDILAELENSGSLLQADLATRINSVKESLQSICEDGAAIIEQVYDPSVEREFKAVLNGTNDGMTTSHWIKIAQFTPSDHVMIKQVSLARITPITNPDVDPDTVACFIKIKSPSTFTPVDVEDFDEIGTEPLERKMPINAQDTYDATYGTNAKFCEAASHPEQCISLGATYPDTNFIGPASEVKNITMNYKLTSRGMQFWVWHNLGVSIVLSIIYMGNETLINEVE